MVAEGLYENARNLGKIDFPPQFVLFCHLREELVSRKGPFGRFYPGKGAPKPDWDRTIYGCGIILVKANLVPKVLLRVIIASIMRLAIPLTPALMEKRRC